MKVFPNSTIVVVGGGAGGLELVTKLGQSLGKKGKANVVLIDRSPIHIWKPHLHEVASGSMDVGLHRLEYVAQARRHFFKFQLGSLLGIDRKSKTLKISEVKDVDGELMLPERILHYDILVFAVGSQINTFNIPGVQNYAIGLDSINDAERFRQKLIAACMRTELRTQGDVKKDTVSIVIIGAGATGVELAAELRNSSKVLGDYGIHGLDPSEDVKITLIEGAERILVGLTPRISQSVTNLLIKMNIGIRTSEFVTMVDAGFVKTSTGNSYNADLIVWAAGLKAPEFLSNLDGLETNKIHQLIVDDHLLTTLDSDIYAIGDCSQCEWKGGKGFIPPRAQSAHQQASYLARLIQKRLKGQTVGPFFYHDFGSLVSLGRSSASGNLMGGLMGGNLFIDGLIARIMYKSLYQMHQYALHGTAKTILDFISHQLRRATEPHIKLH